MTYQDLEQTVDNILLLADRTIIKTICSFVIQARLKIDPAWLVIVGPSSGGKSTILEALEGCQDVIPIDDLTPQTFVSGVKVKHGDKDPSLLNRLPVNGILIFKDLSTIITKEKESRAAIISQLRKIYDGNYHKQFGNSAEGVAWKGRVALIAGATSSIYSLMHVFSDLGERFLLYNFLQPDRIAQTLKATENLDKAPARELMKEAFKDYLDSLVLPTRDELIPVPEAIRREIIELAELATRARSKVERSEKIRNNPIIQVHFPEMPARFSTQLLALAQGLMVINGNNQLTETDKSILFKIALDSIPNIRRLILYNLTKYKKIETAALALKMSYPTLSLSPQLEELTAMEIITRSKSNGTKGSNLWELKDNYRQILGKFEQIELTEEVIESMQQAEEDDMFTFGHN